MTLEKQIDKGIMEAMKAKDTVKRDTLRNVKKYIIEAKKAAGNIESLADDEVTKIIQRLAKQSTDSATIYKEQDREDLYKYEMDQVEVLQQYLPEQLSEEELEKILKELVEELGATTMQDMGRVMGEATKKLAGSADGSTISVIVRKLLTK